MHQQHQQGSSSFQSSSAFQYPPPPPTSSLSLCISNLLIMVTMPTRRIVRSRSNVNLDQDGAFAAALRGAHQSTSGAALFQPSFQSDRFGLDRWKAITATTYVLPALLSVNALRAGPEALVFLPR
jgi:hypothetical protein